MKKQLESIVRQMIDRGLFFNEATREFEKVFILIGLEKASGNRTKAAKMMGLHRNTFRNKFLSFGLLESQKNLNKKKNRLTH